MRITVRDGIGDLADDLASIARRAPETQAKVVREGIRVGNTLARDFAKVSSGAHGKLYPRAFSAEMTEVAPAVRYVGEYGPDAAMPQGGMSFEWGSRNQSRPHLDLNRSADVIGGSFAREVGDAADGLFW